jgi:predicted nucleic acid-binding protein
LRIVLDTNVVVAGVRRPSGASAAILRAVAGRTVELISSPALFLEYEDVLKRPMHLTAAGISLADVPPS